MTAKISISRIHFPITSLGFGSRVGIWFQGCQIQCPGCISRDTWEPGVGQVDFDRVTELILPWTRQADGLTVSGGEPFDQPEALAALVRWWRKNADGDIFVFSGYPSETLFQRHSDILTSIDALVSDPFDSTSPQMLPLRGSDNQRLHLLSSLGQHRYEAIEQSSQLDVCFDGDTAWIAGIPTGRHLAEIRKRLNELGFSARTSNQLARGVRA